MNMQVKICGIRTLDAALAAIDADADFLGFNFVPSSKRYIDPKKAHEIIDQMTDKVKIVGVFQNQNIDEVNTIALFLDLDFVQLHGSENNKYIAQVKVPVIKSFTTLDHPSEINAEYLLLDRINRKGDVIDLDKASSIAQQLPIFLAGGLTPQNVTEIIQKVKPFAVDVAGGIEIGSIQNSEKIRQFIKNAKGVAI